MLFFLAAPEPYGSGFFLPTTIPALPMRTAFFVDGFNLYHALDAELKYHKYKWLDFNKLVSFYLGKDDTPAGIFYFSALTKWGVDKRKRHGPYPT